jgi:hypothetical protein
MNVSKLLSSGFGVIAVVMLALFSIGCSGDDDSPTGPAGGPTPGTTYDEITISLDRLNVRYDCDLNPVGITQPGDFRYDFDVDTLSDNGSDWLAVTSHGEAGAAVSNGGYKNITNRKASFRFPRVNGQSFRVRLMLREADDNGKNDFKESRNVTHIYSSASTQMYAPQGANYNSWNNATKVGTLSWNVNKRGRTTVLGVVTKEGCNATLRYSVTVREVN